MNNKYIVVGMGELAFNIASFIKERNEDISFYEKTYKTKATLEKKCIDKNIDYKYADNELLNRLLLEHLEKRKTKVISAVNTYIFPDNIVNHKNFFGINYHNALLPKHRGMNSEAWSIYSMDEYTGITWHIISEDVDKGGIIIQKKIKLTDDLSSVRLLKSQSNLAYSAFVEIADAFFEDRLIPQKSSIVFEKGEFHFAADVPADGIIDVNESPEQISAQLRAMDYGIFYTMGMPIITINEKQYQCKRYKIEDGDDVFSEDKTELYNDNIVIRKRNSNKTIILYI